MVGLQTQPVAASPLPRLRFTDANGQDFAPWVEMTLGEIGEFKTSGVDKLINKNEKEVYLINYMDVYKRRRINNKNKDSLMVITATPNELVSNNIKKGDILFTPSSETVDDIGHSVVIEEDLDGVLYSYHLMRMRPNADILDIGFSHYFCNTPMVSKQFSVFATGATRMTLSKKSFENTIVHLPSSLVEQQKIAAFLSALDTRIDLQSDKVTALVEQKKALMQQLFSQTLRFVSDDGTDFTPWVDAKLGDFATIVKGSQVNRATLSQVQFDGAYQVFNGGISISGYHTEYNREADTVIISEGGNSCGFVNQIRKPFWSGGHSYSITPKNDLIVNDYLYYILKFNEIRIMSLRVGTGLPNIQKPALSNIKLSVSQDVHEQQKIAAFLSTLDRAIELEAEKLDVYREEKRAFMQQLFV